MAVFNRDETLEELLPLCRQFSHHLSIDAAGLPLCLERSTEQLEFASAKATHA